MSKTQDYGSIIEILDRIKYKDWSFELRVEGDGYLLFCLFTDQETRRIEKSRKWYVSRYSTNSEIVQTALKAVLTAEEHEAREKFLYRNVPVFSPHRDIEQHLELALDIRD